MSIREALNRTPAVPVIVAVLCILGAVWFAWSTFFGGSRTYYGKTAYFSDDDGQSYFAGDINTIVPYTKDGKEVVRAHVFRCASKGTFVGILQRYTPQAQDAMRELQAATKEGRPPAKEKESLARMVDQLGSEYKKPGSGNPWKRGQSGDVVVGDRMAICDNKPGEIGENVIP